MKTLKRFKLVLFIPFLFLPSCNSNDIFFSDLTYKEYETLRKICAGSYFKKDKYELSSYYGKYIYNEDYLYICRFLIKGAGITGQITKITLENYTFEFGDGEPNVFYKNSKYGFIEAYNLNLLTNETLASVYEINISGNSKVN